MSNLQGLYQITPSSGSIEVGNLPPGYQYMPRPNRNRQSPDRPRNIPTTSSHIPSYQTWKDSSLDTSRTNTQRFGNHRNNGGSIGYTQPTNLSSLIQEDYDPNGTDQSTDYLRNNLQVNHDPNNITGNTVHDYYDPPSYDQAMDESIQSDEDEMKYVRIGVMYMGPNGPCITNVSYNIDPSTTYQQLVQAIMNGLKINSNIMGAYLMSATGIYRVDQSTRIIYNKEDMELVRQARQWNNRHDLLFHIHPIADMRRLGCDTYLFNQQTRITQLYPTDAIISNGGPFGNGPKYWIDLSQQIRIKVGIAPCGNCTSGNSCYAGLVYGELIASLDIIIAPTYNYMKICNSIKDLLMKMANRLGLSNQDINSRRLFLYAGNVYYDLTESTRLVYQDYTLWQYWSQLSQITGQEYGPYFHLCPPRSVRSLTPDFTTNMVDEYTILGGNHSIPLESLKFSDQIDEN